MLQISFARPTAPRGGALVVGCFDGQAMTPGATALDARTGGALRRAMRVNRFQGGEGDALQLLQPRGVKVDRIVVVGLGKPAAFDALAAERVGGAIGAQLASCGDVIAAVALDPAPGSTVDPPVLAAHLAIGARLRAHRFDKYRTTEKPHEKPTLRHLIVQLENPVAARRRFAALANAAAGTLLVRDLVSEPANTLHPASFAAEARKLARLGLKVDVLGEKRLRALGLNAMLGVGQGSAHEPQLVVMRWRGAGRKPPIAFVGKGVTFDTGGISIKPAAGLEAMKYDMAGAAVVLGLMRVLARRKAPVNAVGIAAMVENMPSDKAQRPGDVVKSLSGQTIEVIDTDAEGRLVLSDALYYAKSRFKPSAIVDLATLTGSIIVALGNEHAGLFANDDKLAERLLAAGRATGERLWRMPLTDGYDDLIDSDIADMKNDGGRYGDAINAAVMLKRFVGRTPWAHLDIAGMAWTKSDRPTVPTGATGFGVRLLDRFVGDLDERA